MFCATNECGSSDSKKWHFFIKMDGYQKMCDTNMHVTKMGVTIKGVYYITTKSFVIYLRFKFDFWDLISQGYLFHFPNVNWMV
jgi:hypothetical protein